jgi:hypothetical protein
LLRKNGQRAYDVLNGDYKTKPLTGSRKLDQAATNIASARLEGDEDSELTEFERRQALEQQEQKTIEGVG